MENKATFIVIDIYNKRLAASRMRLTSLEWLVGVRVCVCVKIWSNDRFSRTFYIHETETKRSFVISPFSKFIYSY